MVRTWIPVPGTTTGRLVDAALELFGSQGFAPVGVQDIAERAGVTTGSLYHHFGSKAGLYQLVRSDVERRVVDRLEGAAAARPVGNLADLAPVLLVGFDYLVGSGFGRLLAELPLEIADDSPQPDEIERFVGDVLMHDVVLAALVAAAWRAALQRASDGEDAAQEARAALRRLLHQGSDP